MKDIDYDAFAAAVVDRLAAKVPELVRQTLDVLAAVQAQQRAHAFQDLARSTDARQQFEREAHDREERARNQERWLDDERNAFLASTDIVVLSPVERVACQGGALLPVDTQRRLTALRKLQAASDSLAEELGLYWTFLNEQERGELDNGTVPAITRDFEFRKKCKAHYGFAA